MLSSREDGPVYYREIQKCAYLTRITNEVNVSKLRPLGGKKIANKPLWTQFCVHNGKTPYLEQYPEQDSSATHSHKPLWKVCLKTARHITASVKPHTGDQYDFLIDTDNGSVRMLAQDWDSMQDWVTTLRNTLHELKIVGRGENVYCGAPAPPPAPRAPARDPMSPLPPTPPIPPDRVPGIELTPNVRTQAVTSPLLSQDPPTRPQDPPTRPQDAPTRPQDPPIRPQDPPNQPQELTQTPTEEPIDISNWDTPFSSLPSTSQSRGEPNRSVTKICGQNICLDDSIFKRTSDELTDDVFFADIDSRSEAGDVDIECDSGYKQRLVVGEKADLVNGESSKSNHQPSNITVIQVSNKDPPHTAIPVLGPETNVFDFEFKEKLALQPDPNFVNIVNTEHNDYGTTFNRNDDYGTNFNRNNDFRTNFGKVNAKDESLSTAFGKTSEHSERNFLNGAERNDYGHISLTTTVNLTGSNNFSDHNEGLYDRLCMASTSNPQASPLAVRKIRNVEISRKSSLPNLESNDSTYEYLFLSNNNINVNEVNSNDDKLQTNVVNGHINRVTPVNNDPVNRVSPVNSDHMNRVNPVNNDPVNRVNPTNNDPLRRVNSVKNDAVNIVNSVNHTTNRVKGQVDSNRTNSVRMNAVNDPVNRLNSVNEPANRVNTVSDSLESDRLRSVERSRSQNTYDSSPRARENIVRRVQNNSPMREIKNDKTEPPPKPKWKRGFTELSLLTRRAIGQVRRQDSPTRQDSDTTDRCPTVTSPLTVVHRSRTEARVDTNRRRSSSLSNGDAPLLASPPHLQPLRARQAAALRAEQRRGAALVAPVPTRHMPIFADYNKQVWVCWWGSAGARWGGRAGDRVCAVRGAAPRDAAHARQLLLAAHAPAVDVLFHRVPLGNIFVINKREHETLGIKLDSECNITYVESESAAGRAGLPPPGKWALTEVNNRPINLIKGGEEDMNRLSMHGAEVSLLFQPSPLVKKLRAALKGNKSLLGLR